MSKECFQIAQDDRYILAYINNCLNAKLCLVFACDYYFYLKISPHRPDILFSTTQLANFVLTEFCKAFKMPYFYDATVAHGFSCLDANNYFYKNIKRVFGGVLARSPFFSCINSEEGVNYYTLTLVTGLDKELTKVLGTLSLIIQQIKDDFTAIKHHYRAGFLGQQGGNKCFDSNFARQLKVETSSCSKISQRNQSFFKLHRLVLQKRKLTGIGSPIDSAVKKAKIYVGQIEDAMPSSDSKTKRQAGK